MEQFLTKRDIQNIIEKNGKKQESLIATLLEIQQASGKNYVSEEWADTVAKELNIPLSVVYDVLTFYSMFSIKPRGKYIIELCKSAGCHVTGSQAIMKLLEEMLEIKIGETTEDGLFTLQATSCFGACNIGPAIKIGDNVYGDLSKDRIEKILDLYREGLKCQNR